MNASSSLKLIARRTLAAGVRFVLRLRSVPYEPGGEGCALVIAPHPDDESFGCGGWIATQRAAGRNIQILFLTDGSASHSGHPQISPGQIAQIRFTEAVSAARALGLEPEHLHFFNFADGLLSHLDSSTALVLSRRLREFVLQHAPDEILLPCRRDGSSEHEAAFQHATAALADLPVSPRVLEFPVWSWWSPRLLARLALSPARIHRCEFPRKRTSKEAALACYVSQINPLPPWTMPALPSGFVAMFSAAEEYFFES
jgi:N-acetylglucosamine malate deacetylase 1